MTNLIAPNMDYNAAYQEIISRLDVIEQTLPTKSKKQPQSSRKNPTVSFNCPATVCNQLSSEAAKLAITRSELLRMIVAHYLEGKNKPQGFTKLVIDDDDLIDL